MQTAVRRVSFFTDLVPALEAEMLKTRRTLALTLAFLAPALVVGLEFCILIQRANGPFPEGKSPWLSLSQSTLVIWTLLMLPLFITLETALLGGLEHASKNWKHIFALPISRGAVYAAKQIVAMALMGLSSLTLWAAILAAGYALRLLKPGIGFEAPAPLWVILRFAMVGYLASWLIIALHTWVAMHWSSFVVACSVGIAATVIAVVLINSDYGPYYPWTLPALLSMDAMSKGAVPPLMLALGSVGGVLGAILGGLEFTRRDVL
jgi:lantibiotic transport system permease protein